MRVLERFENGGLPAKFKDLKNFARFSKAVHSFPLLTILESHHWVFQLREPIVRSQWLIKESFQMA